MNDNICQLRLDFDSFQIDGPVTSVTLYWHNIIWSHPSTIRQYNLPSPYLFQGHKYMYSEVENTSYLGCFDFQVFFLDEMENTVRTYHIRGRYWSVQKKLTSLYQPMVKKFRCRYFFGNKYEKGTALFWGWYVRIIITRTRKIWKFILELVEGIMYVDRQDAGKKYFFLRF
jgi:hypothetical protein